ncbi:MAG: RsmB/NOP family class I SAM-dependent RNA methyltransferase [Parachlamydiaceae bacterium]
MYRPFREYHILSILNEYDQQALPLDLSISNYFRAHKALGSKDRGFITETIYAIVRWKGLLDFLGNGTPTWEERLDLYLSPIFTASRERTDIPLATRLSFPQTLFDRLVASHGIDVATDICTISNTPAPTTVRVNTLKTTREEMLKRWRGVYPVYPCEYAPNGIVFEKRINFFELAEFKEGLFEIQDEGSQLLSGLVQAKPGDLVMDYCAGAGGKTLAFAPQMNNTGQIFLHDIRKHTLQDSSKRLRRAGIQNAQIVFDDEKKLKKLKKTMDWVLVDAPCTGTGTLRRNPDMKWKLNEEMITRLLGLQRVIFEKALSFMKPTGRIVYATCSVLHEENRKQTEHFIATYNLEYAAEHFESLPVMGGMDGFYGVVLKNSSKEN